MALRAPSDVCVTTEVRASADDKRRSITSRPVLERIMSVRTAFTVALCALLLVSSPSPAPAQDVVGPSLKAAVIYRFALFATWPASDLPPAAPVRMCVAGDGNVRTALERTVSSLTVDNRPIVVAAVHPDQAPPQCHILYISAMSAAQAARLVTAVRDTPVLTMSDLEGFNKMGGIAELFYEAGGIRFRIDRDAVQRSGLQLSSRLLGLSR